MLEKMDDLPFLIYLLLFLANLVVQKKNIRNND